MKQWVEEAGRTQSRLADTLAQAPGIMDTHPIVALPEMSGAPKFELDKGAILAAVDRATIGRQARTSATPTVPVANSSAQPRPMAVPAGKEGTMAKAVEPLVDVLKARAESGPSQQDTKRRLRPEEVQAMIDQARQEAPVRS
jgi:hypothetical protein